ncbi:hypothetical protein J6O48_13930 [bacterium]|nr:hypothetical protein [bacterium]
MRLLISGINNIYTVLSAKCVSSICCCAKLRLVNASCNYSYNYFASLDFSP